MSSITTGSQSSVTTQASPYSSSASLSTLSNSVNTTRYSQPSYPGAYSSSSTQSTSARYNLRSTSSGGADSSAVMAVVQGQRASLQPQIAATQLIQQQSVSMNNKYEALNSDTTNRPSAQFVVQARSASSGSSKETGAR